MIRELGCTPSGGQHPFRWAAPRPAGSTPSGGQRSSMELCEERIPRQKGQGRPSRRAGGVLVAAGHFLEGPQADVLRVLRDSTSLAA